MKQTKKSAKPKVFIGSSTEGLDVARAIELELAGDVEVTRWDQPGVFDLGLSTLQGLLGSLRVYDFAIFILTPDDITKSRSALFRSPRDNVVLELGMFLGQLGPTRVYILTHARVKMPSDLAGVTLATYEEKDHDSARYAVGPAATQILRSIRMPSDKRPSDQKEIDAQMIGLQKVYARTGDSLEETLREVRRSYRFLGVSAQYVIGNGIWPKIVASKAKGATFSFLLLDPHCAAAREHAQRERRPLKELQLHIAATVERLLTLKKKGYKVQWKFHDTLPTFRIVIIDDSKAFISFYEDDRSFEHPQLLLRKASASFFHPFFEHWKWMWMTAK